MAGKKRGLESAELSSFCSQVALILSAGLPLYDGMETLAETARGSEYADLYENVSKAVNETGSLYQALQRDDRWPTYLVEMTGIGEQTGQLENVMNDLSEYYAREDRIRSSVIGAITYPLVLGVMLVLIIAIMTSARDSVLNFIRKIFPPMRNLSMKLASSRVASVLSMMLHSGFPTNEAFRLLPSVLSDGEAAEKVQGIRRDLDNGMAFADAISNSKLFDPLHDRMIRMGVAAGREDQVMGKIAGLYEEQVEEGIDRLVAIIEPTLIALLAVVIGAVLLSVMLPMAGILSSML